MDSGNWVQIPSSAGTVTARNQPNRKPRAGKTMEKPHPLTVWGANPKEADKLNRLTPEDRFKQLQENFTTYELHVGRNKPVSITYPYWFSRDERIFTDPEQTRELELDPKERDGLYKTGLTEAFRLAQAHPQHLVFLYSPPGPASFKYPPDPEYKKPYDIGQLYLMYYDGKKINNLAVSVNGAGEKWLGEIFTPDFIKAQKETQSTLDYIRNFITTPQLTGWTMDDFLEHPWQDPSLTIFTSRNLGHEEKYQLTDILQQVRDSLLRRLKTMTDVESIAREIAFNGGSYISESRLLQGYQTIIANIMNKEGVNQITLGGGCGGGIIRSNNIFNNDPVQRLLSPVNLSSSYRKQFQQTDFLNQSEDYKNDPNLCQKGCVNEPHFDCPGTFYDDKKKQHTKCELPIIVGNHITKCPKCGVEATCT